MMLKYLDPLCMCVQEQQCMNPLATVVYEMPCEGVSEGNDIPV